MALTILSVLPRARQSRRKEIRACKGAANHLTTPNWRRLTYPNNSMQWLADRDRLVIAADVIDPIRCWDDQLLHILVAHISEEVILYYYY